MACELLKFVNWHECLVGHNFFQIGKCALSGMYVLVSSHGEVSKQ